MNKGVDALELDTNHPVIGEPMDIISGYWDRGYRCNIDSFIYQLRESDWTMKDSIRYTDNGCNTIGGTSGSPIIQTGTRNIIGINNTGNESGERCTMDNPCEVDEHGNIRVKIHASYGQETYNIYSCLSLDFRIELEHIRRWLQHINTKGVKPMTFRKNLHDGIKVSEIEERRYCLK
jgi:hypothetical protein